MRAIIPIYLAAIGPKNVAHAAQDVFLDGRMIRGEAVVQYVLVDEVAPCGPREQIAECLEAWCRSSATTLICVTTNLRTVRTMAGLAG